MSRAVTSLYTLHCNKAQFLLAFQVVSFPVSHEVVSSTSVVHRRDLPGLPTGGEQPHLRKFLHQLRGNHCVFEVGSTQ